MAFWWLLRPNITEKASQKPSQEVGDFPPFFGLVGSWRVLGPKSPGLGAQEPPRALQEPIFGPILTQLGPNMDPTWPNLAPFGEGFGRILAQNLD